MKKLVAKYRDEIIPGVIILACWEILRAILARVTSNHNKIIELSTKIFTFSVTVKIPVIAPVIFVGAFVLLQWVYYKWKVRSRKLKIIKATYGTDKSSVDITRELNEKIEDNRLKIVLSNNIAGDPHPGTVKKGTIKYEINSRGLTKEYKEGDLVNLP